MTLLEAILLGIVQGIFMFFPVSSTSHMVLLEHLMGIEDPDSPRMVFFNVVVHVGTLISIAVVFRRSLGGYLGSLWRAAMRVWQRECSLWESVPLRLALFGLFTVLVTGVIGLVLRRTFQSVFDAPLLISVMLVLTGVLLYFTDSVGKRPRGLKQITLWVALVIGVAQALALVPGLSRSGLTIAFALFIGVKRRWAAQYSFFVAFPTILAISVVQLFEMWRDGELPAIDWGVYAAGFIVAAMVGIVALWLVMHLLYRARFRYFSYYVWALAAVVATAGLLGWLSP